MAHDDDEMGAPVEGEWCASGEHVTRGGKHFGRWWTAERATITDEGVVLGHTFYGYQPGAPDIVRIDGIDAAREFAAQLLDAIDYAEATRVRGA